MLGSDIENRNRKTESLGAGFWPDDSDYDVLAVFLLAVFIERRIQSARLIKRSPLWTHAPVVEVQCRSVPAKSPRDSRRRNTPSPLTRFCRVSALHYRPASRRSVSSTLPLFDRLPQVRLRAAVTSSHVAQPAPGRTGGALMFVKSFVMFFGGAVRAPHPLRPAGYAIVAVTVAAFALVAMLCTSSIADELGRSLRLSWWFS